MTGCDRLLFVYNADSGLYNTLADIGHKLLSPGTYPCDLCSLTHGYLRERTVWRDFLRGLPATCEFLHRDQFRDRWPDNREPLPAVFCLSDERPEPALGARRIAACHSLAELMDLVRTLVHCPPTENPKSTLEPGDRP